MENKENFNPLNRVVYKQNALIDLSNFAKKYQKILIFTSKAPKNAYFTALSGFLNDANVTFSVAEINLSGGVSNSQILGCIARALGYDCLIAFGAGSISDITKIVAKELKIPFIVVPTTLSHFGYFSNFAFLKTNLSYKKVECNYPEKVFIEENFIKNSPDSFVLSACSFVFSFAECYVSEFIKNKILNTNKFYEINNIKDIILKTEGLVNWLCLHKDVAYLNLMDNIIELYSNICKLETDLPCLELSVLNSLSSPCGNFGKACLVNCKVILMCYLNFWKDNNLFYKNMPNVEKNLKILENNGKNSNFLINFMKKFKIFTTNKFFLKTKSIKKCALSEVEKMQKKVTLLALKLTNNFTAETPSPINLNNALTNLNYVALTTNCYQLNALMRLGYLNF